MKTFTSITGLLALATLVQSQGAPNTVAALYPNLATQVVNGVFFLVPVDTAAAQSLSGGYPLIQAPGFAAGTHPALVWSVYSNDIRQNALAIPSLMASSIIIPYVDRLGDGKTPFSKSVEGFIGGTNGNVFGGVVPATVGTLASAGGYPLFTAIFDPDNAGYKLSASANNKYYVNTKLDVIPNLISGPGVTPAALDFLFASGSGYAPSLVRGALNQPAILPSGMCQRNNYRFNETFAGVTSRSGTVTMYSPVVPAALTGGTMNTKVYSGSGFSGTGELIMFNQEDCATAASRVINV